MASDKLTELAIRKAKPGHGTTRLYDGHGMYLEVRPSGAKWWRHKFRYAGKEKLLSLGVYPETSLSEARARRSKARELLAQGIDPSVVRKARRNERAEGDAFEAVARELHASRESTRWGLRTPSAGSSAWSCTCSRMSGSSTSTPSLHPIS